MDGDINNPNMKWYPYPAADVVGSLVGEEAILVQPERAKVKVLNRVGARIWELSDGSRSVADIAAQISREYQVGEVEAQKDAWEFIQQLAERGLLLLSNAPLAKDG